MELKDYITYLKGAWVFILIFGLVAGGAGYAFSSQRPDTYRVIQSYEVELVNRGNPEEYQYGSYYDLMGAELFTQHLVSLLHSPAVIEDILQSAGMSYEIKNVNRFTNQFQTDQDSNQQFTVQFSRFTHEEGAQVAEAMTTVLQERVKTSQVSGESEMLFRLRSNEPVILFQEPNVVLSTIVAAVAGWMLSIVLVLLRRYLS